jgi:hypothetical protein
MKIVAYNAYKNGSGYVADWLCCAMCEQVGVCLAAACDCARAGYLVILNPHAHVAPSPCR